MHQRRKATIESVAEGLLNKHKFFSTGFSLEALLKKLKIDLQRDHLEDNISGYSAIKDKKKVIVVNQSHGINRRRFSIAHELGHLTLHEFNDFNFNENQKIYFRNDISATGMDEYEIEANYFAACLLMPKKLVITELEKIGDNALVEEDDISNLAIKFKVSVNAMMIRLIKLNLIDS
ncbi:MAG: ImmA/IrrE family metallo-endopeptidase [Pseudobdellovibrio sp.]